MKTYVNLADRKYEIHIGEKLQNQFASLLKQSISSKNIALLSGDKVYGLYQQNIANHLINEGYTVLQMRISSGEANKNLHTVSKIYDELLSRNFDRGSAIIALGGGIIGDIAGYVAATLFRGINFVQMPTTLLAQVDSSIGGKTGVNHPLGKNLIGAFYQPKAVLIHTEFLKTLPPRELLCGYAEILKMALIADSNLAKNLWTNRNQFLSPDSVSKETHLILRAIEIKKRFVERDETETNQRMLLNFGHTIGHAIENVIGYGNILHGEAVLMGMIAAIQISAQRHLIDKDELETWTKRISLLLKSLPPFHFEKKDLLEALQLDKKVHNHQLKFILLKKIGEGLIINDIKQTELDESLDYLEKALQNG